MTQKTKKQLSKDPCSAFPPEIISVIFKFCSRSTLHSCVFVNKRWNALASISLWHSPWSQMANNWKLISHTLTNEYENREIHPPRYGPMIKHLDFSDIYYIVQDFLIQDLAKSCTKLQTLIIDSPRQLSDNSVGAVATFCTKLLHLELRGCTRITDDSMSSLVTNCRCLSVLNLENCPRITDVTFTKMAKHCGTHLISLNVANSLSITDESLLEISKDCYNMRDLNLANCRNITDIGVSSLSSLTIMRNLNISHCNNVTDESLKILGKSCVELKSLDIIGCRNVTEVGVNCLIDGCMKLELLRISEQYGMLSRGFLKSVEFKYLRVKLSRV
ncbi:748_t:CDS:1 [Ambispora gerdemannii]|uniref:748_t:CDS:1 n=1 Tax=Ambispora gerdemannii TaxID=144530 RepID=A0A9N8UYM5_9GLOM|nr:748_t:CDS:1 [Ambispora gerdemannii]